ncbi:superoxide dismutase [Ni] [Lentisphaerota bacterium WC36G]|nr:hypothetical protein LJT99_05745 [Lentisphaerae bacterium WC36]
MKYLNSKSTIIILLLSCIAVFQIYSHCQMPCAIYHDEARFDDFDENIETLSKAMSEIQRLQKISNKSVTDVNQLVRWIDTKDDHAELIQDIATEYFLTQRIKMLPKGEKDEKKITEYFIKLRLLHEIMVKSMKCKQTVDLANVRSLADSIEAFEYIYLGKEKHEKMHKHKAHDHKDHDHSH